MDATWSNGTVLSCEIAPGTNLVLEFSCLFSFHLSFPLEYLGSAWAILTCSFLFVCFVCFYQRPHLTTGEIFKMSLPVCACACVCMLASMHGVRACVCECPFQCNGCERVWSLGCRGVPLIVFAGRALGALQMLHLPRASFA